MPVVTLGILWCLVISYITVLCDCSTGDHSTFTTHTFAKQVCHIISVVKYLSTQSI